MIHGIAMFAAVIGPESKRPTRGLVPGLMMQGLTIDGSRR
jgi:hypothetical protein